MKIELKHVIENDGSEWYNVVVPDKPHSKWFLVNERGDNRENQLDAATQYFNKLKEEGFKPQETILVTDEIPTNG